MDLAIPSAISPARSPVLSPSDLPNIANFRDPSVPSVFDTSVTDIRDATFLILEENRRKSGAALLDNTETTRLTGPWKCAKLWSA